MLLKNLQSLHVIQKDNKKLQQLRNNDKHLRPYTLDKIHKEVNDRIKKKNSHTVHYRQLLPNGTQSFSN